MRIRLPWHRQAEPVAEVFEVSTEEVAELPTILEEAEPPKGLTHILEWVPVGWAYLEVDRGDGKWDPLHSGRQSFVEARYKDRQEDLEQVLTDTRQKFILQEEGSREWIRLDSILAQFSQIQYRVRSWGEEETNWVQHSLGMERPLRRIMVKLIEEGFPEDRLVIRALPLPTGAG